MISACTVPWSAPVSHWSLPDKDVISAWWAMWSVPDQPRHQCMRSHVIMVLCVTNDIVIQYYTFCSFWFQKTHVAKLLRLRLVSDLFLAIWTFPGLPTDSTNNSEIQEMLQSLIFSKILKVLGHSFAGPVFIIHLYVFKCFPNHTGFQRTFKPFSILKNEYRRGLPLLQITMM